MKKLLGCGSYRLRNGLLLGAVQISLTIMFWGCCCHGLLLWYFMYGIHILLLYTTTTKVDQIVF